MSNTHALDPLVKLADDLFSCYEEIRKNHSSSNIVPWLNLLDFLNEGRKIIEKHKMIASEETEIGRAFAGVASAWPDMDQPADEQEHWNRFARLARAASRLKAVLKAHQEPSLVRVQQQANALMPPVPMLFGWPEILRAVALKNNKTDHSRLARLNALFSGPILSGGKGKQPTVNRDKLVAWWNGLEKQIEEQQQRERDQAGTVDSHYSHGRAGTVMPQIQGSVKRRKSTRKP